MKINIIFGTESGFAELDADDIAEAVGDRFEATVEDMSDVDVHGLDRDAFYLVICSTYGEGELPVSAKPFYDALSEHRPDLTGLRYAVLGRGDSTYQSTYSRGSELVDEHGVPGHRHRLDQGAEAQIDRLGQSVHLRRIHDGVLGHASAVGGQTVKADHAARVVPALPTRRALAAVVDGPDRDLAAGRNPGHPVADLDDGPRELVSEDLRPPRSSERMHGGPAFGRRGEVHVQVGAADARVGVCGA